VEPSELTVDALQALPEQTCSWDGVRSHEAKNNLIAMRVGDGALFYESSVKRPACVAVLTCVTEAHPDPTQFDVANSDEKSVWVMVRMKFERRLKSPVFLDTIKNDDVLNDMEVARKPRLSVSAVSSVHWAQILKLSDS
jgi:predicted RNA-binding protein with PUA-like domain